jgi:hypothetical protein
MHHQATPLGATQRGRQNLTIFLLSAAVMSRGALITVAQDDAHA